jgi:DNA-directed RNA polymerase sigma subunit (sigma70/sigma32)
MQQSGMLAMLGAWKQWTPGRSTFGHYAMTYIRGAINREVQHVEFATLRYDDYCARPAINAAREALREEAAKDGRVNYDPTFEEIAARSKKTVGQVKKVLTTALVSMSAPLGDGITLGDTLDVAAPEVVELDIEESIKRTSELLGDRHIQAVFTAICVNGLDGSEPQTINDVSVTTGVNRESLRRRLRSIPEGAQREMKALFS